MQSMTYSTHPKIFEEKAELLKVLGHPVRLCIVKNLIEQKSANVTQIQNCLKTPQSTISQHLAKLRTAGIIEGRREGTEVHYSVVDEKVKRLIEALFS
ncbi:DNA-binding transcriptional regulator, ArsR family [Caldanaerovirga acetigignens]|uniref:DNA-binding transcriptional regulator, ArsR family n=2 Tax=Caldanaerovirga acetigignens TaxID=447595 RepID=A0A1M7HRM8_9FIRM|nr:DNA-binding transcriptional regulator, ArsR family [Caldanaerovirga acetigignens]